MTRELVPLSAVIFISPENRSATVGGVLAPAAAGVGGRGPEGRLMPWVSEARVEASSSALAFSR